MQTKLLPVFVALLIAMYLLYCPLTFMLMDRIFEKQKHGRLYRGLITFTATAVTLTTSALVGGSVYSYLAIFLLLTISLRLLYESRWAEILFCSSACIIHIMALRAITTAIFSIATGLSIYGVANDTFWFVVSIAASATVTNLAIVAVIRFIPAYRIKILNQHSEQQYFMIAWMTVFNLYLLYNANVFRLSASHPTLTGNELIAPTAILLGLYIVLFFAFKTAVLLGYEEKSVELQQEVYREQQYRSAATKDSLATYEVNVTKNLFLEGSDPWGEELGETARCYSDVLSFASRRLIHSEDIATAVKQVMPANLIREYEAGKSETTVEYRRLLESGEYIWVRAVVNLLRNKETGDIIAFICVRDIDEEKRHQLGLQYRAERDPLTGLYNKEMTGKLINERLRFGSPRNSSVLFMIDVDCFKGINDHFGHVYGDSVLCELGAKLRLIFRSDDIVGRIGGDEYIAFMENGVGRQLIEERAAQICEAFYTLYKDSQNGDHVISGSMGVAISPKDGISFEELYHHADIALYVAKRSGRNTFAFYDGGGGDVV